MVATIPRARTRSHGTLPEVIRKTLYKITALSISKIAVTGSHS